MKKCVNCQSINKDTDIFCRNCGAKLHKSIYYVLINIGTILVILGIIFMIILFIASYMVF